ncbi:MULTISPECIES: hypothetical protein [Pseudomonas syringae group]|uniref:hypothetical protein n=1 Tax=Pseudomonas syringae group TaxID=136849 RepID=UPI0011C3DB78|nr:MULTISPECIES: hypothetical protein [Pseudomonas syringae group]
MDITSIELTGLHSLTSNNRAVHHRAGRYMKTDEAERRGMHQENSFGTPPPQSFETHHFSAANKKPRKR